MAQAFIDPPTAQWLHLLPDFGQLQDYDAVENVHSEALGGLGWVAHCQVVWMGEGEGDGDLRGGRGGWQGGASRPARELGLMQLKNMCSTRSRGSG